MEELLIEGIDNELLEEIARRAHADGISVEDEVIKLLFLGVAAEKASAAARTRDDEARG